MQKFLSNRLVKEFEEKVPNTARILIRAGEHLEYYGESMLDADVTPDEDGRTESDEILALAEALKELAAPFVDSTPFDSAEGAAVILLWMLQDWQRPGSVWFKSDTKRFRLCGEGYQPGKGEECVGVYMPDVNLIELTEDLKFVMEN